MNTFRKINQDNFENLDLKLYGIVCPERIYRLAYFLNKISGFDFSQSSETIKSSEHPEFSDIPYYFCLFDGFEYFLMTNKSSNGIFLKKFKNIDYWLLQKKTSPISSEKILTDVLSEVKVILGIFEIQDEKEISKLFSLFQQ